MDAGLVQVQRSMACLVVKKSCSLDQAARSKVECAAVVRGAQHNRYQVKWEPSSMARLPSATCFFLHLAQQTQDRLAA
jgi:hypothetical protein